MEGHDYLQDCFKDVTHKLFAVETSLSADPQMCNRYDALDNLTLLSNSYAHSPHNLGHEVNLLNTELSYDAMFNAFKIKEGLTVPVNIFRRKANVIIQVTENARCLSVKLIIQCVPYVVSH